MGMTDDMSDLLERFNKIQTPEEIEQAKKEIAKEIESKGFLPLNDEYDEIPNCSQDYVENNPRQFIIEECIPACQELWSKNIYTFMVSDHQNEGECWIEVLFNNLSEENKSVYSQLNGEGVIKFSYHPGYVNFGIKCVGVEGQQKLLELAKMFKMQDVPQIEAWISVEKFLMKYCNCYDEFDNPNYKPMASPWEVDLKPEEMADYVEKYYKWESSEESQPKIRKFAPNKVTKSISEYANEHGMIYDDNRIYLSQFHYQKHLNYVQYIHNQEQRMLS